MLKRPTNSNETSIQERVGRLPANPGTEGLDESRTHEIDPKTAALNGEAWQPEFKLRNLTQAKWMPFDATGQTSRAIPFEFDDYLEPVDWTGRAIHPGKRGQIPA
ncbi:MAG: hypothetical protein ACRERV_06625 [Methylococcales bacterium]